MKKTDILAVNPGSTSTKVGVYRCQAAADCSCGMLGNMTELFVETINHNPNHLLEFENLEAQLPYRREVIESVLKDNADMLCRAQAQGVNYLLIDDAYNISIDL